MLRLFDTSCTRIRYANFSLTFVKMNRQHGRVWILGNHINKNVVMIIYGPIQLKRWLDSVNPAPIWMDWIAGTNDVAHTMPTCRVCQFVCACVCLKPWRWSVCPNKLFNKISHINNCVWCSWVIQHCGCRSTLCTLFFIYRTFLIKNKSQLFTFPYG